MAKSGAPLYPLRVGSERFFRSMCEMALQYELSLVEATRGCGELEEVARADLANTRELSQRFRTLKEALHSVETLNVALCDAQQYGLSLIESGAVSTKAQRLNCYHFVVRCREFRQKHIGKNILERAIESSVSKDYHEVLADPKWPMQTTSAQ